MGRGWEISSLLLPLIVLAQPTLAVDARSVIDNAAEELSGDTKGRPFKKIDLHCQFEDNRMPADFRGTYTNSSQYLDEGSGTFTRSAPDLAAEPQSAIFQLRRNRFDRTDAGKLYVYIEDKHISARTIYQIDRKRRIFAVNQQRPTTDELPFTEIFSGTCWGVF
jgi:hypothetical protein